MSLSSAVSWWEEWQLRILVLGSLALQLYLAFFAPFRKWPGLNKLHRLVIWLSYLGGDALAIYALATLFNRQKKLQYSSPSLNHGGSHDLEVLWAPILLMHLGGRMTISAYNIEDNELWLRHIGVAISQVTVTLYVFCTSWSPSADKKLLAAAVVLFVIGIFKCFEKPFALRRASFNTLVTYFRSAPKTESTANKEIELENYIQDARDIIAESSSNNQQQGRPEPTLEEADEKQSQMQNLSMPDKLFVDYTYDYNTRLNKLKFLWLLDFKDAFDVLRGGLSRTFNLFYTKLWQFRDENRDASNWATMFSILVWNITITFPIAPIILFHISHKQAYRGSDIKVTYLLLYITYFSEILCVPGRLMHHRWYSFLFRLLFPIFPAEVAQHSLIGVLAGKRRSPCIAYPFEYLKINWLQNHFFGHSYKSTETSTSIMSLVHAYARDGWMNYIRDVESYWKFSDIRGHWTLERNGSEIVILRDNVEKPLDESIILWHLATDFCFHLEAQSTDSKSVSECASMCRCISHYMMHLLSANPEMLLPGSRQALFQEACKELDAIPTSLWLDEKQVTEKVIEKASSAADECQDGFLPDAWELAQGLMQLAAGDDDDGGKKMWQVIRGVWIEMLCFSAYRCRGYLHAKSLAYGGELLTFVSLLMSHAGLETFAERQQRWELRLTKEERMEKAKQVSVRRNRSSAAGVTTLGEEPAATTPSSASALASASASSPAMEVVVVSS